MKKAILFCIIITLLFSFNIGDALAQGDRGRPLETTYPTISGIGKPTTTDFNINLYARYIYYFAIAIGGLLAFAVIVNAGLDLVMSSGDPGKMQDAKSKIFAGILGLLILLGSYLLLYTINPDLVTFNIQPLRITISRLSSGVLLCKEPVETEEAWDLQNIFDEFYQGDELDEMIADEIEIIIDEIMKNCYYISGSGDIRGDFDDKAKYIYFIPYTWIETDDDGNFYGYGYEYGAILYEDDDYKGKATLVYDHLKEFNGERKVYGIAITGNPSSIKPYQLIYKANPEWNVTVYESYRLNKEVGTTGAIGSRKSSPYKCATNEWWCVRNFAWSPKSMQIKGDLIAFLVNEPGGGSEAFSSGTYNNLEGYDNIIDWVDCPVYVDLDRRKESHGIGGALLRCANASANFVLIISGTIF